MTLTFSQIQEWPAEAIRPLLTESELEGFRFLRRAEKEWLSQSNTFSGKGEALFAVFDADQLLAVGGINRAPDNCGRLRRFYVSRAARRKCVGTQLALHLLRFAQLHYKRVVLRCDTDIAEHFYQSLGFIRVNSEPNVTHAIEL